MIETKARYPISKEFIKVAQVRKEEKGINILRSIKDALLYAIKHKDEWY